MNTLIEKSHLGDKESLEQLIRINEGLIHSVVKRFLNRGQCYEDLYQIGCIGMIKAVKRFDSNRNVCFSTYVVPVMIGEIKQFIRDDNIVKTSRKWKSIASKVDAIQNEIRNKTGKELTIAELSNTLNIDIEDLMLALDACHRPESFESIDESTHIAVSFNDPVDKIIVKDALEKLNAFEHKLILLRYYYLKSQKEIGNILGISQAQVSRTEKKFLIKLRNFL